MVGLRPYAGYGRPRIRQMTSLAIALLRARVCSSAGKHAAGLQRIRSPAAAVLQRSDHRTAVRASERHLLRVGQARSEEFEDFVLAHAPQFVEGMVAAGVELEAGETVSLADTRAELEIDEPPSNR